MKYTLLLAFLPCFTLKVNGSQPVDYDEIHKPYVSLNCFNEKTQKDMDKCGDDNLLAAEEKMKSLVKTIIVSFKDSSPQMANKFKKSQILWEESHKIECEVETYDSIEGSGYHSILSACLEMKINERISYLRWLASNI